jgi:hypothetical protein
MTLASFESTGKLLSDHVRLCREGGEVESVTPNDQGLLSYERYLCQVGIQLGKAELFLDLLSMTKTLVTPLIKLPERQKNSKIKHA